MWWLNDEPRVEFSALSDRHPATHAATSSAAADALAKANAELLATYAGSSKSASSVKQLTTIIAELKQSAAQCDASVEQLKTKLADQRQASETKLAQSLETVDAVWHSKFRTQTRQAEQLTAEISALQQAAQEREQEWWQVKQVVEASWDEAQAKHDAELETVRANSEELERKCRQHETAFQRLEKKLTEFESEAVKQLTEAQINYDAKVSEAQQLLLSHSDLQIIVGQRDSEIRELRASNETLRRESTAFQQESEAQLATAQAALETQRDELAAQHQQQLSDLATATEAASSRNEAQIRELDAKHAAEIASFEKALFESVQRANLLRAELDNTNTRDAKEIQRLSSTITSLEQNLGVTHAALDQADANSVQQKAMSAKQIADLVQRNRTLEGELHHTVEEARRTRVENQQQQMTELLKLQEKIELASVEQQDLAQTCNQQQAAIKQRDRQLSALQSKLKTAMVQQQDLAKQCDQQKTLVKDRDHALQDLQRDQAATGKELRSENETLRSQLATSKRDHEVSEKELEGETQSLRGQITELQRNHGASGKELEGENQSLRSQLATSKRDHEVSEKELEGETQSLRDQITELQRNHGASGKELEGENQSLRSQLAELQAVLDAAESKAKQGNQESRRLTAALSTHSAQHYRKLRQQDYRLTSLQVENERLQKATQQLRARLKVASQNQSDQAKTRQESLDQTASLQETIDKLTADFQSEQARLKNVQQELAGVRQRRTAEKAKHEKAIVMVWQLKQTITWLEENAASTQKHLQREAAARRKAEAAVKREALSADVDPAIHEAWIKIDTDEKGERLNRELEAARAMLKAQQQRVLQAKRDQELARKRGDKPAA